MYARVRKSYGSSSLAMSSGEEVPDLNAKSVIDFRAIAMAKLSLHEVLLVRLYK